MQSLPFIFLLCGIVLGAVIQDLMFDHHVLQGKPDEATQKRIVAYYTHLELEQPPFALFIPIAAVAAFGILIFRTAKYRSLLDIITLAEVSVLVYTFVGIIVPFRYQLATVQSTPLRQLDLLNQIAFWHAFDFFMIIIACTTQYFAHQGTRSVEKPKKA